MNELWLISAAGIFVYMTVFFVAAMALKDNGIVDIAWGGAFILVVLLTVLRVETFTARHLLLNGLVLLWGLRLAFHIHSRNRARRGEDFRYAEWRRTWGKTFVWRSFLQIYMLQGFLALMIATPILLVNQSRGPALTGLDFMGLAVWCLGFFFEAVGDYQLIQYKKNGRNQGKIIMCGLWRYTRHPNYFGEATMWWGLFLIAVSVPGGWQALISPVLLSFLLLKVSGIPMLEAKYAGRPDWEAYKRRTSAFFPWFPKAEQD